MKVTQEKLPASQVGLEIEIPAETSQKAYEQTVQKFMRQATIPGFRKGKVPRQVILQRFGVTSLKAATLEDLIDDTVQAAIKQAEIKAIGNFQLKIGFEELVQRYEPGTPLVFSASVDVQPEVNLQQYKGLSIKAEEVKFKPERVDEVLEGYREQVATLIPVESRSAQRKDIAVVDFKGMLASQEPDQAPEEFDGNEAQDFQLELEDGKFVEGFVDGMIGMLPGETKDVTAQFPESYSMPNLAGRTAIFTVTLKELKEKELPELDDDFAQEVSDFETLAELRESLEKRFAEEAEQRTKSNQEEALLDELLNYIEVDLPETLIEKEANYMLNQTAMELQNRGMDIRQLFSQETIPKLREEMRPEAIARIKRTLALGEVAKQESLDVSAAEISAKAESILEGMRDTQNIDRDRLNEVVAEDLLKGKIVDWLIENSTIELVPEGTLTPEAQTELADPATSTEITAAAETIDVAAEAVEPVVVTPATEPPAEESTPATAPVSLEESESKSKKSKKTATSKSESDEEAE